MDIVEMAYIGYESPNNKAMLDAGPAIFGFGLMESRDGDTVYLTMDDNLYRIAVHPGEVSPRPRPLGKGRGPDRSVTDRPARR